MARAWGRSHFVLKLTCFETYMAPLNVTSTPQQIPLPENFDGGVLKLANAKDGSRVRVGLSEKMETTVLALDPNHAHTITVHGAVKLWIVAHKEATVTVTEQVE